jgi:hypothetical protein
VLRKDLQDKIALKRASKRGSPDMFKKKAPFYLEIGPFSLPLLGSAKSRY